MNEEASEVPTSKPSTQWRGLGGGVTRHCLTYRQKGTTVILVLNIRKAEFLSYSPK